MVAMPPFSEQDPKNEYFDVYSPEIKTLYGQVFWTSEKHRSCVTYGVR